MNHKSYTILILMQATSKWLSLSNDYREKFFDKKLAPIFRNAGKDASVQFLSSKHFHAQVSDFIIVTVPDLITYQFLMDRIHNTLIYTEPYFEIVDIIQGHENGFHDLLVSDKSEKGIKNSSHSAL